ncbi:MAG: response regulator [Pseudomonadota bacterium]
MKKKNHVLLVDDDADLVETYRIVLEKEGYRVTSACNGEEGLKKAQDEMPDLIVLDVMMSTYSEGFEVARELRRIARTKKIPILMLTSVNATVPFKFEADETWLPVDRFVEKPLTPKSLIKEVSGMLE